MKQEELNRILELHQKWLNGEADGERANLNDANLTYANLNDANLRGANLNDANLRGANLTYANLRGANLNDANLRGTNLHGANLNDANLNDANLHGANLRGANLTHANLRGANLNDANLLGCIGNMREVKSLQLNTYKITHTKDRLQIGCKNYAIEEWFKFTDEEIARMDTDALDWWYKYKDYIKLTVELSPAI